ncbi:hypothetical protein AO262_20400, partial [Pseudomonas fluorescens ABAC62]
APKLLGSISLLSAQILESTLKAETKNQSIASRRMIMKRLLMCLGVCSVFTLHGCFDNAGNTTKNNSSGTKSSVQMQEGKADESK